MRKELVKVSKFLSLVLRHKPEEIGLVLDENGWADVMELLSKINKRRNYNESSITRELLDEVVATNEKKRFAYSEDGKKIRASQGHSIDIDLNLSAIKPPEFLYHGTASHFVSDIMKQGLKKMGRQHVHMSSTIETAINVGSRHGKPQVLKIKADEMYKYGYEFFKSENNVWLTDEIPVKYIELTWENNNG